jgi:hypothetical protein
MARVHTLEGPPYPKITPGSATSGPSEASAQSRSGHASRAGPFIDPNYQEFFMASRSDTDATNPDRKLLYLAAGLSVIAALLHVWDGK